MNEPYRDPHEIHQDVIARLDRTIDIINRAMVTQNVGEFCFFCGLPATEPSGLCLRCSDHADDSEDEATP